MGPGAAALSFLVGMLVLGFIDSLFGQPMTAWGWEKLTFPVVMRSDDGEMIFCATSGAVMGCFEIQDLTGANGVWGWDSRGRRFRFGEHGRQISIQVDGSSSWDEFDRHLASAYQASPEIVQWRQRLVG